MSPATNKGRKNGSHAPFATVDKPTASQWRCAACHNPQKGRLDTVKDTSLFVNTTLDSSRTDRQTFLCACCLHINTLKSKSIVDNVIDATNQQTDSASKNANLESESKLLDLRNRINKKYPNLGALLSSTLLHQTSNSSTATERIPITEATPSIPRSNSSKATEQIPTTEELPSQTCHISELLSAVGDEDDTHMETCIQSKMAVHLLSS